jgi:hypothetical protein
MTKEREGDLDARARAVAMRLNNASDRLNASLLDAQTALVEMGLGVWARATVWRGDDGEYQCLAFGKHNGRWGLVIESGNGHAPPDSEVYTPVLEASRDDRQWAAGQLPELFEALIAAAEKEVDGVERAIARVDEVAAAASKARS